MSRIIFAALAFLPFLLLACTEEGFVKVFECTEGRPYFSKLTHYCYKSQAELEEAEKNDPRNKPTQDTSGESEKNGDNTDSGKQKSGDGGDKSGE